MMFFFYHEDMTSIPSTFAQDLVHHPVWNGLSWETRGMALQLMAMTDPSQLHTLAPEDQFWRNCLNIPSKHVITQALQKTVSGRGAKPFHELDVVWNDVWKPELLRWFVLIDDSFLQKHTHYQAQRGRYWCPALHVEVAASKAAPVRRKTASGVMSAIEGQPTKKRQSSKRGKIAIVDLEHDYPLVRFTQALLRRCWEEPASREERLTLWNDAVGLLAGGDKTQEATARQFIGKLIKDYGEQKVASQVAQLLVRPVKPADCKSFLRKQLKNVTEGSEAVQRARLQRVKVPL